MKALHDLVAPIVSSINMKNWEDPNFYKEYLAQTFHYVSHSTRLLALAAAYSTEAQSGYYRRSLQHIREEAGHEKLALADLQELGGRIEDHPELGMTRALWEPQYYKTQGQATALLGYILGLEQLAISVLPELHLRLQKKYKDQSLNFIRVHAEEDPDHVEKCLEQIEALAANERVVVWKNVEQTLSVYLGMIEQCALKAGAILPVSQLHRGNGRAA